jgi:hypothetical protein
MHKLLLNRVTRRNWATCRMGEYVFVSLCEGSLPLVRAVIPTNPPARQTRSSHSERDEGFKEGGQTTTC